MIERKNVSVSLTPELLAFATARVQSGNYSSVSEVVRAGLRLLGEREHGDVRLKSRKSSSAKRPHA